MLRRALCQLRRGATPHRRHLLVSHYQVVSGPVPFPAQSLFSGNSKPLSVPSVARFFSDDASSDDPPAASAESGDVTSGDVTSAEPLAASDDAAGGSAPADATISDLVAASDGSGSSPSVENEEEQDLSPEEIEKLVEDLIEAGDESGLEELIDMYVPVQKRAPMQGNESDFEDMHDTDDELDNLYNARQYVEKKMVKNPDFNMDDKKWDEMIRNATEKGFLHNTKECEGILEDMLNWDKLLPDVIKKKVQAKYNELEGMCDRGELEGEKAYELFKEYEDKMVSECIKIMDSKKASKSQTDEIACEGKNDKLAKQKAKKVELDDPPGEGPVLRWESRVVFAPGGDAWHPKNRKVKLSVTVKELGLSKYACKRLRALVGKRYNSGRDELTITSERYEHREENRKDCLRTLYGLIQDAVKADKLVEEARNQYVKERLKKNVMFMERLKSKVSELKQAQAA